MAERGGEVRLEDLECDLSIVLEIVREVDRGHAAGAELPLGSVPVSQGGSEPLENVYSRTE